MNVKSTYKATICCKLSEVNRVKIDVDSFVSQFM